MLDFHNDGPITTVRISGKLSEEDYEHLLPEVERSIEIHGKIRILWLMHDFHGWQPGALWEDIRFDTRHFADIERVALVGEAKWQLGMTVLYGQFTQAEIRYFNEHQLGEAEEWIWADIPGGVSRGAQHSSSSASYDRVQEASEESFPAS